MKTQDIRNMGLALQSVQEKILTQKDKEKALAKAARSAKPKSQVSLKPMPASLANKMAKDEAFKKGDAVIPSKGPHKGQQHNVIHDYGDGHYNISPHNVTGSQNKYRQGAAKAHKSDLKKMTTGVVKLPHEALKGDQHKLDHDNDGDIDAADFKKLRNKKKGMKSEVKPRQEPDTEKDGAPMEKTEAFEPHMMYDPKTGKGYKADKEADHLRMKKMGYTHDKPKNESTRWPIYARIMEKQDRGEHYKSATDAEKMDSKENPGGKKMRKDMKADNPDIDDTESKSHQDAADAGRKGPGAKARPNDNMKGDKNIVNPVKGAVTSGSN